MFIKEHYNCECSFLTRNFFKNLFHPFTNFLYHNNQLKPMEPHIKKTIDSYDKTVKGYIERTDPLYREERVKLFL